MFKVGDMVERINGFSNWDRRLNRKLSGDIPRIGKVVGIDCYGSLDIEVKGVTVRGLSAPFFKLSLRVFKYKGEEYV